MPVTPDDIVNYELNQTLRGYSVKQVDALLDEIADELERLRRELDASREQVADAERRAAAVSETEAELKGALVTAQRAAEQTVGEARSRAQEIVAEAEREAEQMRQGFRDEAEQTEAELRHRQEEVEVRLDRLREFEREYRENLRRLVERHLLDLDELERGEVPESDEAEPSEVAEPSRSEPFEPDPSGFQPSGSEFPEGETGGPAS